MRQRSASEFFDGGFAILGGESEGVRGLQMTKMLDLLEDYLQLRKWPCHRIDGTVHWQERQVTSWRRRRGWDGCRTKPCTWIFTP